MNPTIVNSNYFVVETLTNSNFNNIELVLGWMNLDTEVESDSLTTLANSATPLQVEFNSGKE